MRSRFGDRPTVGHIYREAQFNGEKQIIVGDMNYELRKSLCDDINDTIKRGTIEFEGRPFYITVYEKWDLQMKKALVRKLIKTVYRPYPEADTQVYKVMPYSNDVYFCWDLPQRPAMLNMLNCPDLYNPIDLLLYRRWENMQLEYFGFMKNDLGNWIERPMYGGDQLISSNPDDVKVTTSAVPVEVS